jgi:hypothetical protein
MARFQRKFIDPNRPPEIAYDSPASASFYEYHHRSIRQFVDEIVRGTLNGCAVTRLPARVGIDAVTDPKGLFGQLKTNGFIVFPTNDVLPSGKSEDGGFNGWLHGREVRQPSRVEFGTTYPQDAELENTLTRAAKSIGVFYEAYSRRPTD